jgi:hypothetical protein
LFSELNALFFLLQEKADLLFKRSCGGTKKVHKWKEGTPHPHIVMASRECRPLFMDSSILFASLRKRSTCFGKR